MSEKALQGEIDATLTFWNFCADLESKGHKRAIAMDDVMKGLGAKGPVALVGYTFDGTWAARNGSTVERFLSPARQAKDILASSEAEWQRLAPRLRVTGANVLAIYRQRYSEGIVRRRKWERRAGLLKVSESSPQPVGSVPTYCTQGMERDRVDSFALKRSPPNRSQNASACAGSAKQYRT